MNKRKTQGERRGMGVDKVSLDTYPGVELLGHMVVLFLVS